MKQQADDALSPLETAKLEENPADDNVSVLAIELNLLVSPCKAEDDYFACSVCDKEIHKLPVDQIPWADKMKNKIKEPPSVQEFIDEESTNHFCKMAATSVGMQDLQWSAHRSKFLVPKVSINGAVQKVVPKSLQARIHHDFLYPVLSDHPGQRLT